MVMKGVSQQPQTFPKIPNLPHDFWEILRPNNDKSDEENENPFNVPHDPLPPDVDNAAQMISRSPP